MHQVLTALKKKTAGMYTIYINQLYSESMEQMGTGSIDWQGYRLKKREELKTTPKEELRKMLAAREAEMQEYEQQYGHGNSFGAQAQEDAAVLRELINSPDVKE